MLTLFRGCDILFSEVKNMFKPIISISVEFSGENGVQSSDRHGTGEIGKTPEENWPAEFKVDYVKCYQYKDKMN